MLKKETFNLLNKYNMNFRDVFSICIGNTYLHQSRFIDYIGKYNRWDTDVREGTLILDNRVFNVEYIGTTSTSDNYWYSSELERAIPYEYVNLMTKTREIIKSVNLQALAEKKILLNEEINGYNLSMIYIAFAPENTAYFCGGDGTTIYMFVKNLPESIFRRMNSVEFPSKVMEIISTFNVNHKLMIKALLCENGIAYNEDRNNIIAKFNEESILTIEFNDNERLKGISGNLSL